MKLRIMIMVSALYLCTLYGCATAGSVKAESPSELPSITQIYAKELAQTYTGMPFSEFSKVWTGASLSSKGDKNTIYEVTNTQHYYTKHDKDIGVLWTGSINTHSYTQILQFYFKSGKLTKWVKKDAPVSQD